MQPWAGLILSGRKTLELRTWRTDYRGPLLICAGARLDPRGARWEAVGPQRHALAMVELLDVRTATDEDADAACFLPSAYAKNCFAWVLGGVRPVRPFAVSGKQGLFDVTPPSPPTSARPARDR